MYNHGDIDKKWQDRWLRAGVFSAKDFSDKPKKFLLVEFPFPSGAGLHVGHPRSYVALDALARKYRMEGYNVLYPMGWDAFGLPTENYAIKTGRQPAEVTAENVATFKNQIQSLGLSFDWSREINSTDSAYYKWTQWQFLKFFKAGLAYKAKTFINWCPKDKIGLANEEAAGGVCERCGGPVEKREKEQWMIGITKYADRLLSDLDTVDYLPKIRKQQEEWIGKSEGAEVEFLLAGVSGQAGGTHKVTVFTTRPDTLYGATYIAISAELARNWMNVGWQASDAVKNFVEETFEDERKREATREDVAEKKGVPAGIFAINPVNGEKIPVWIANYVLSGYGTGAIMAVPAHDERDFEFAKKFGLKVIPVIDPQQAQVTSAYPPNSDAFWQEWNLFKQRCLSGVECFTGEGPVINSAEWLNGLRGEEAKQKMIAWLEENKIGARKVTYKLRDWVFSRQRYWGEPIPLVHCETCAHEKLQYVFIHGYEGSVESEFFPWLKKELESKGHSVVALDLPHPAEPNVEEQVQFLLDNVTFTSNTVIVAHSLGTVVAQKLLPKLNVRIRKTILVDGFMEPKFVDHPRPKVEKAIDWVFDAEKVNSATEELVLLVDEGESVFSLEQHRKMAQFYKAAIQVVKPVEEHFCGDAEPTILELTQVTGWNPIPDSELPLTLPQVDKYEPTDTGESPLASIPEWVNTTCPRCGSPATRETDTMPNWAGSSWYFLRYIDAHNDKEFAAADKLKYWMPVDLYNGGMEHTTLHLLYSRFWNKFMYDSGFVPTAEPYARRVSHGLIMAEDGTKMSKSKGNVVNPDDIVREWGSDTLRVYEMFIGPFSEPAPWSMNGVSGVKRFLDRVMRLPTLLSEAEPDDVTRALHKMIKAVTEDYNRMSFNTAVAQYMTFVNTAYAHGSITRDSLHVFLRALNIAAPHVSEEVWEVSGGSGLVCEQAWPTYDSARTVDASFELVVQVNGKVRDRIEASSESTEDQLRELALASPKIQELLAGGVPKKIVVVPGKLVSIVM